MVGRLFQSGSWLPTSGEKARMLHGRWLTRALSERTRRWPVIPTRPVADGGFSRLRLLPEWRAWADEWWETALGAIDDF